MSRVCISAPTIETPTCGGVWTVVRGLISGLSRLDDGPEDYVVLAHPNAADAWLREARGDRVRVLVVPRQIGPARTTLLLRRLFRRIRRQAPSSARFPVPPDVAGYSARWPISSGLYEALGADVIHFPWPRFVVTSLPALVTCHDVQHRYYPQFFTAAEKESRESELRTTASMAQQLVVGAEAVRRDLISMYGATRVAEVSWAAPSELSTGGQAADIRETLERLQIRTPFVLYPAMTWPHKNHERLVAAVALAARRGSLSLTVVCTGHRHERHWTPLQHSLEEAQVGARIRFLGMVPHRTLNALYASARCLFFPSLFEGGALPIYDAWHHHLPVVASRASILSDLIGEDGLLFDPESVEEMAQVLTRLSQDDALLADLRTRGARRSLEYSWERTARAYRALYRRTAGWPLNAQDLQLLSGADGAHPPSRAASREQTKP